MKVSGIGVHVTLEASIAGAAYKCSGTPRDLQFSLALHAPLTEFAQPINALQAIRAERTSNLLMALGLKTDEIAQMLKVGEAKTL